MFEDVVEAVAVVSRSEAGLVADLVVFEFPVVFEADELAVGGREFGDEELEVPMASRWPSKSAGSAVADGISGWESSGVWDLELRRWLRARL